MRMSFIQSASVEALVRRICLLWERGVGCSGEEEEDAIVNLPGKEGCCHRRWRSWSTWAGCASCWTERSPVVGSWVWVVRHVIWIRNSKTLRTLWMVVLHDERRRGPSRCHGGMRSPSHHLFQSTHKILQVSTSRFFLNPSHQLYMRNSTSELWGLWPQAYDILTKRTPHLVDNNHFCLVWITQNPFQLNEWRSHVQWLTTGQVQSTSDTASVPAIWLTAVKAAIYGWEGPGGSLEFHLRAPAKHACCRSL